MYNVLPVLLFSLCIRSGRSFQLFLKSSPLSFLRAQQYSITIVFNLQLRDLPSVSNSLPLQQELLYNIFVQLNPFPLFMISLVYRPSSGILQDQRVYRHMLQSSGHSSRLPSRMAGSFTTLPTMYCPSVATSQHYS